MGCWGTERITRAEEAAGYEPTTPFHWIADDAIPAIPDRPKSPYYLTLCGKAATRSLYPPVPDDDLRCPVCLRHALKEIQALDRAYEGTIFA